MRRMFVAILVAVLAAWPAAQLPVQVEIEGEYAYIESPQPVRYGWVTWKEPGVCPPQCNLHQSQLVPTGILGAYALQAPPEGWQLIWVDLWFDEAHYFIDHR